MYPLYYNIYSEGEVKPLTKGSEDMNVNATELLDKMFDRLEKLVRENEQLKAEVERLQAEKSSK